jgi:gamma-glutamyltranspeptidase/glutathione hydrolase
MVLGVVDPMSTSLGGDCFAIVATPPSSADGWRVHGINGSGRAPARASLADLRARGASGIPTHGILSVTVPGALRAFSDLVERFGRLPLARAIEPAARIARDGFEVTRVVARDWQAVEGALREGHGTREAWLVGGERAPREGERFRAPVLAATLDRIAQDGVGALYEGAIADAIVRTSDALGGWLAHEDLRAHASEWVAPMEGAYRGHPIYELPPNGQGVVVLEALGILDDFPLADVAPEERAHTMIEAVKLAFADARAHVGDPDAMPGPASALLDEAHLEARRARIGARAIAAPEAGAPPFGGDTVYVAAVDEDGLSCSLIASIYEHFGARVVADGTGLTLQNRGALFSADASHPAALGPRRRPYHTIIPALAFREDQPWLTFGVVGGFQQPQAQVQILSNVIDLGMTPEAAVRAPRFRWLEGASIRLEHGFDASVAEGLARRGHVIVERDAQGGFGGAQLIARDGRTGALAGASDPRKDGRASWR